MNDFARLFDLPYYQLGKFPLQRCIGSKVNGKWSHYSTAQFVELVNKVSLGLLNLGLQAGDRISLISFTNRPEWNIMDMGMQQIGVINVPVYPTISPREYEYIFNDAGVKLCFVDGEVLLRKVRDAQPQVPCLQEIYTFNKTESAKHWEEILAVGSLEEVEKIKAGIKPEQLATLIYTSGTTGNPKGVMLSHNNIISNIKSTLPIIPLNPGDEALSFLPLCHIFERMVTYGYMSKGVTITYAENVEKLGENLQEVKPHFFTTVPRLLEKVFEKIYNKGHNLTGIKKQLFFWALHLADTYEFDAERGILQNLQWAVADKLIFSKWRAALGGNIKGIVTGAAACPTKMARVFSAAGIPIREGYGLTETSPALCLGRFTKYGALLGTIGPVIDGVEIKIAADGEILAKGPNIMLGYYNKPDATAEVMDADGWFHTGDIGEMVQGKHGYSFLKITDRKKELLKTSGGKYVAPNPIETMFKQDFHIEQIMVVGEGKKFVSALIVPAFPSLEEWAKEHHIGYTSKEDLIANPKVLEHFEHILHKYNTNFSHIEQIKKFTLLTSEWTIDGGELTPTMKLKRRVILQKYNNCIDQMYAE
ncbi:long-chain fatty acid--CoA ligase [Sphingobacteriales bacterium UPWRP_1]|nr:long-chain fatty acid--CoA ligase [Sphingobacteriales bacterium TSM_CSS]PSJ75920.1 long-chain fatty acid--CoA ligase [Sphingobacteriales bacterium UPWRP_1]